MQSDDGAESREASEGGGGLADSQSTNSELKVEDGQDGRVSTPLTPTTPGIRPVEHDSQRRAFPHFSSQDGSFSGYADKEPLLSLKISRSGHLFAVITSKALTIWQTKARGSNLYRASC
jgi:RAB6A-GEF complex partner protein 1